MQKVCFKKSLFAPLLGLLGVAFIGFMPLQAETRSVRNENTGVKYTDLQLAIDEASSGDTLKAKGKFTGSFVIDKSLTIEGRDCEGRKKAVLDGFNAGRVVTITVNQEAVVKLKNLTIQNGLATDGGGILNRATLTLDKVKVENNVANNNGGGIYNEFVPDGPALINILNSSISSNRAASGGGIVNDTGTLFIENSKVNNNLATTGTGGGFFNFEQGVSTILNTEFSGNSSVTSGGGLAFDTESCASLVCVEIKNNITQGNGGGVIVSGDSFVSIDHSKIKKNTAIGNGGGVFNEAFFALANSIVEKNTAADGGGIFDANPPFAIFVDTKITNNVPNDVSP